MYDPWETPPPFYLLSLVAGPVFPCQEKMAIPSGGTPRLGLTQGDGIHGYTDSLRSLVLIRPAP